MPEENLPQNPYAGGRDHESDRPMDREDVLAVAGLLGSVTGALGEIDKKNVGGQNQFVQAKKIDPKQALSNIAKANGAVNTFQQPPPVPGPQSPTQQVIMQQQPTPPPPPPPAFDTPNNSSELEARVRELETIVQSYKKIVKFKRGISYSVNTTTIKGEFKDPATLLDLISTEMAKNTKSITIKLVDASKPKK